MSFFLRTLFLEVDFNIDLVILPSKCSRNNCPANCQDVSSTKLTVSLFQPVYRNTDDGRTLQSRANVSLLCE
jgi:hypothetical protein